MDDSLKEGYSRLLTFRNRMPVTQWPDNLRDALRGIAQQWAAHLEAPFFPPIVYIEPTNACNCRCVMCPRQNMTRPLGYITMALFNRIVGDIAELGPSEIRLFNFGEPLLHPQLPDMVRLCRTHRLPVRIQTNGLSLPETKIEDLLNAGLDYLGVSVNGLTDREYALIRPDCRLEDLKNNLLRLRRLADRTGKPFHIHINAHLLKEEACHRQADIDRFVSSWHGIPDSLSISGLEVQDRISIVKNGILIPARLAERTRKADADVKCAEPFDRLVVKWDGRVTPCCADYDASLVLGDLNRQPLPEIWNSPALKAFQESVKNRRYSQSPLCRACCRFYSDSFTQLFMKKKTQAAPAPLAAQGVES
ncbi:MAG: SPASM domain-containing protein [Lentisphaerae bacterium]|nr:SPASM domain-containing protein [Lentisphaerota bacterium]